MNFPALIPVGVPGVVTRRFRITDAAQLNASVNESREHLRPFMPWASLPPLTIEERVAGFMKVGERERPPEAPGECEVLTIWRVVRSAWPVASSGLLSSTS